MEPSISSPTPSDKTLNATYSPDCSLPNGITQVFLLMIRLDE